MSWHSEVGLTLLSLLIFTAQYLMLFKVSNNNSKSCCFFIVGHIININTVYIFCVNSM